MIGKQRRHKKDTTDIVLFKEKEQISDIDPPLSCFKLISYLPPKFFVSLEDQFNLLITQRWSLGFSLSLELLIEFMSFVHKIISI